MPDTSWSEKNYTDALREIKNAMQLAPGDSELSMLAVLAAWYQGGRACSGAPPL